MEAKKPLYEIKDKTDRKRRKMGASVRNIRVEIIYYTLKYLLYLQIKLNPKCAHDDLVFIVFARVGSKENEWKLKTS